MASGNPIDQTRTGYSRYIPALRLVAGWHDSIVVDPLFHSPIDELTLDADTDTDTDD